nr:G2/M phase-specific E3 ubiquitin-protein ligase-like [Misgurnus anguillicaudatus]
MELFKPQFTSPRGSNNRRKEARAVGFWRDWLLEVEGGGAAPIFLPHVLIFGTGLERIPPMGFSTQPELSFLHEDEELSMFPTANTCSLIIRLSIKNTYSEFKNAMEMGIGNCEQFGMQ